MIHSRRHIFALLLTVLAGAGCDSFTSEPPDPPLRQTEILEVRVEPHPVAVGDTATFTVIIEDSLDASFRFTWDLEGQDLIETEENTLQWIADVDPGEYTAVIMADNGDLEKYPTNKGFLVNVVE